VLVIGFAALLMAPFAHAEPPKPKLIGTTPDSPSTSLAPFVHGASDGVIISAVPAMRLSTRPIASSANPANVIRLFTGPGCTNQIAQGTAGQLDSTGIQVTVAPDTTTAIYANQAEGAETSGCSDPIFYTHMTTLPDPPPVDPPQSEGGSGGGSGGSPGTAPPSVEPGQPSPGNSSQRPAAPRLRTVPGGRSSSNAVLILGSAPGAGGVKVFASPDCSGSPVAKGTAAQFGDGFQILVVDDSTTAFSAVAVGAGGQSGCSDPVSYVEDSTPPHTRITLGPASKTRNRSPVFRFVDVAGDAPGTAFFCKVDKRKWTPCRTPLKLKRLKLRPHVLRIKAVDPAGNAEQGGAKRRFKVIPRP
jgi:hypothetical protein